jgi:hypothetical protein
MKLHTMGKIILLGLLLCAITMQSQEVLWEKSYGNIFSKFNKTINTNTQSR